MATFNELVFEAAGKVPGYSPLLAQKDIARAWRSILDQRTWSFLIADGGFNAPAFISSGSVAVTIGLTTITFDTVAGALLAAVPLTSLLQRQFRIAAAGELYNITAYDSSTRVMTLDRPVLEATASAATYMIYQCYFPPPPEAMNGMPAGQYDFNRWLSIVDPINGYPVYVMDGKKLLDRADPQRSSFDQAWRLYDYKTTTTGVPLYEMWPHPSGGQTFICLFKRRGNLWTQSGSLPQVIPDDLVLNRALYRSIYPWAATNAVRMPGLKHANWSWLIRESRDEYLRDLQAAKLQDDNITLQSIVRPEFATMWPPTSANWLQGHSSGLEPYR